MTSPSSRTAQQPVTTRWVTWGLRGTALVYLACLLLIPSAVVIQDGLREGVSGLWRALSQPAAWSAMVLTLWTSVVMALINAVMGTLTAYVLVRYPFRGKALLNALIDVPLAIPTLVTGVMLVILYGPQSAVGKWVEQTTGIRIIFAQPGIILALLFITFPFVVRAVQPVLAELDRSQEEAAATLGASTWAIFRRVTLPPLLPAIFSGTLLSFARAIGEFGAVVVVAGNIPLRTQTAAVYVLGEIESDNRLGASAMSIVMMALAFSAVMLVDWLHQRQGSSA